jgi:hypothetical protein
MLAPPGLASAALGKVRAQASYRFQCLIKVVIPLLLDYPPL